MHPPMPPHVPPLPPKIPAPQWREVDWSSPLPTGCSGAGVEYCSSCRGSTTVEACAYGNASAQYDYYNYDGSTNVRKAFDGQLNNYYAAPTSTCATQSQWMQFTFNTPTDVAGFAITPRNSLNAGQDAPRFFTLDASTDGSSWVTLYMEANATWTYVYPQPTAETQYFGPVWGEGYTTYFLDYR